MHEDLLPLIDELERSVEAEDSHAATGIVGRLSDVTIYSGNEVYERFEKLKGRLAIVLFDGLGAKEFGQLAANCRHLYASDIWAALEPIADRILAADLWALKDYLGFSSPARCPHLYDKLASANDASITAYLIETIDRLAANESTEGQSLSDHERTMSAFRYVRWAPHDQGLADHIRLLAARRDELAREASARYLRELPWGADRKATLALLEGMSSHRGGENTHLFREALSIHDRPPVLRSWLWGSIGEDYVEECLLGAIGDLAKSRIESEQIIYIDFLWRAITEVREQKDAESNLIGEAVVHAAEDVSTSAWSSVARGYYAAMLSRCLPGANVNRVSNQIDRAAMMVAIAWEFVRLDHMGCLIPLTIMLAVGWLLVYGLSFPLGDLRFAKWLPTALILGWLIWSLVNVRTHFSGHETIRHKLWCGLVYFGLLLAAIASSVLCRVF